MKQQHHPTDTRTYEKGISSDINKEILGAGEEGGHIDALNMRSMPMDGNNLAAKKIKGEDLNYPNIDNRCFVEPGKLLDQGYVCMMTQEIDNHIIEIWANPKDKDYPPFMRVDGQIVLMSDKFPVDLAHPLQYHKNENCVSGEFYITNNNTPPMVFSLKDLMTHSGMLPDTSCDQTYFDLFNIDKYTIQSTGILHKPSFIKQTASASGVYDLVIGGTGMPVGSYSYSYRYVTTQGDRTPFSPFTELIPVVRNNSTSFSPYFPNTRTFASVPDINSNTPYGNHIRIKYENNADFSFIEIRRDSWYTGTPIDVPPISEVIGSIPITAGLNVINVLDRASGTFEGAVILDLEEQTNQFNSVERAKSIRYFNDRLYLMNVAYKPKDLGGAIKFVDNEKPVFPVIQKLFKAGHKNVFNSALYKSYMRGEKHAFAVVLFDEKHSSTYAEQIPGSALNYQFPNRREPLSSESLGMSYMGTVYAMDVDGNLNQTHEVFDHYDAVRRQSFDDSNGDYLISVKENDPFNVLTPTSQNDTDTTYQYRIDQQVGLNGTPSEDFNPKGFGLDYYSMGYAFKGIQDYPEQWGDGFSVVQTDPAMRVVAQGFGFYSLSEAEKLGQADGAKSTDSIWAYFPDLELLYPEVYEDVLNNPTSYQIQFVSPLGYYTEVYSHINDVIDIRDKGADMIVYPRIMFDGKDIDDGQTIFNPKIANATGFYDPTTTHRYIPYGKFTNTANSSSPAFPSNGNGNAVFDILQTNNVTTYSGSQSYLNIKVDAQIYNETGPNSSTNPNLNADDAGVMEWREPMYVVNLIKNSDINPGLTTQYKYCANYIKFKSLVLESDGSLNQSAQLVSERWEDCIPTFNGEINNDYAGYYRFVYVVDEFLVERRWLNVTNESGGFISGILGTLSSFGSATVTDASGTYDIYGIYTHTQTQEDMCPVFTLNFDYTPGYENFTAIPLGSNVYVKYDNRIPVRIFNGDTYVNESIWAVMDNEYGAAGEPKDTLATFTWNIPFPFKSYEYADGYRVWQKAGSVWNYAANTDKFKFNETGIRGAWIRQMVTMWTAETRINLSFAFNNESPEKANLDQHFPLVNYITRPYKWQTGSEDDRTTFENNNKLNPLYFNKYGYEWNWWSFGGFRFSPQTNIDYTKSQTTTIYTSTPAVGFTEQSEYCTRVIWSERRPINIQNTPTVKTFAAKNYFDISDDTGEIKFAFSCLSNDKGNNLYAITDSGVCLLLVDKRIIHEINANELATVGSDIGGILGQLWIDRTIGMSDETWRSWAEYSNSLFFMNDRGVFAFAENELVELSRNGFYELFERQFLSKLGVLYDSNLCGVYNVKNKEYIFNIELKLEHSTMIYGVDQKALQCQSSYNYDKYLQLGHKLYGMRDAQTFELGIGNTLFDGDITCYITGVSDKDAYFDKEFIRIRVNSHSKPEQIYFYDSYDDYKADNYSSMVDAVANPIAIKDYYGYECYIPRKDLAPHYRQQGRVLIFKIVSTTDEEFLVVSTGVQYKALK